MATASKSILSDATSVGTFAAWAEWVVANFDAILIGAATAASTSSGAGVAYEI